MKRFISTALSVLMTVSLAACGGGTTENVSGSTSADAAGQVQMGRWIENEVELGGREIVGDPALLEDGTLSLYVYEEDAANPGTGQLAHLSSADNGETWTEEDTEWGSQVEGFISRVWQLPDGTVCLRSVVLDEESRADNSFHVYWQQEPAGDLKVLEIEGVEDVNNCVFYDGKIFFFTQSYGETGASLQVTSYDKESGDTHEVSVNTDMNYGMMLYPAVAGDKLMCISYGDTAPKLVELNPQDGTCADVLNPLSEAVSVSALTGDAEGAVYYPTPKGIYRLAPGGTLPEQIVSAEGTAMSVTSNYPNSICRAANGDFLVTQMVDSGPCKLYRYHYDESMPTHAETTLNVWALQESPTARAAINLYKQQHPEVDVTYTVAIPADTEDITTARNDALTKLNTELLAGNGPDLLILDGIAYENYAQKGMLADLSDAVPLAELQANLTEPFVEEGKAYVLPARFSVPVLIGDAGTLDGLKDLASMQQVVLDAAPRPDFGDESPDFYEGLPEKEKYALCLTDAEDFADFLLPTSADAILQDGTLNEEALRQTMEFVQTVSDYYGIRNYTMENNTGSIQSWSGSDPVEVPPEMNEYSTSSHAKYGWFSMDTPYAVIAAARRENPLDYEGEDVPFDLILRPGLTAGAYTPKVLVGVNANGAHLEEAKQLAASFFDAEVQGTYLSDGITVRADCLQEKLDAVTGNDQYSAETFKGDLFDLLNQCTTPVVVPSVLRDAFVKHTDAIIQGTESAEDAVQGVTSDVSLYLAEQK